MPTPIHPTEEIKRGILEEVMKKLASLSAFNGIFKLEVPYTYEGKDRARVSFTSLAWRKQKRLVSEFSSEVGWHGVCKRDPEDPAHFIVEDILIFPQAVTGATVTPSQEEYDTWKGSLSDEHFNNLRFHGHSHVNMDVNPSGTDTTYQKRLSDGIEGADFTEAERKAVLEQMGDSCFYVFMILNKSGKIWARIRDLYYNIEYASSEIDIVHEVEVDELADFVAEAKSKVRPYTYSSNKTSNAAASNSEWWRRATGTPATNSAAQSQQKTHGATDYDDYYESLYPHGYWDGTRWRE